MIIMIKEQFNRYVGLKVGVETSTGKYLFGVLTEVDNSSAKIQFLNKARVLIIPVHSIISIKLLEDNYGK